MWRWGLFNGEIDETNMNEVCITNFQYSVHSTILSQSQSFSNQLAIFFHLVELIESNYSRVHISSDDVFINILKKPTIVQE